jgi:glycerophosphoryl diester phosphodiesterase
MIGLILAATTAAFPAIEVQGHRGARAVRPENTLPAFEYALEVGAGVLELDLSVSKDDRLIVVHDQHVSPDLCLGPGGQRISSPGPAIRSLTFAELRVFDCGSLPNPRFPKQKLVPGTKMPALEEVFALVRASKHAAAARVRFNIETKIVPGLPALSPPPDVFAKLVVDAVRASGFLERTSLQSFDHRVLVAAKKLEPKLELSALISDNFVDHVAIAKSIGARIISPDKQWITKDAVAAMHAAQLRVIPWTANSEEEWETLLEMGVDGIITDDPGALIAFLTSKRR